MGRGRKKSQTLGRLFLQLPLYFLAGIISRQDLFQGAEAGFLALVNSFLFCSLPIRGERLFSPLLSSLSYQSISLVMWAFIPLAHFTIHSWTTRCSFFS